MTGSTPPAVRHVSVLPAEVMHYLEPEPGQIVVDATVGAGGHARLIAERIGQTGQLVCLDRDPAMLELARRRLEGLETPVRYMHGEFDQLRVALDELGIEAVHGVIADLGICSDQLDDPERGFSFQQPGPLDMRMDREEGEPASALLHSLEERDLADLIWKYGEERFSRRVAKRIVEQRRQEPIETTEQLAELVRRCVPRSKKGNIDPATRVFQALRIAVNDELGVLERFLQELPGCLTAGGRAVIISFHSLEDRLVKNAFRNRDVWEVQTKKPVQATEEEMRANPRSRSAKLRAARKK